MAVGQLVFMVALGMAGSLWIAGLLALSRTPMLRAGPVPADAGGVSVVIPARDEEARIGPLLDSLRMQTVAPLEIIVVDDESTKAGTARVPPQELAACLVGQNHCGSDRPFRGSVVEPLEDLAEGKAQVTEALPIVTVVTIPATSSEMNATSVVSNDALRRKEGFVNPLMFPKVSILDPELTYSIPPLQTAISAADVVSHLMEGYINHNDPWAPMQDRFAQGMIKTVMDCMERLMKDPKDAQARGTMMWVSTFAWNGFYVCGLGAFEMPIHMVGHTFSAFYDAPHGSAMSISSPAVMKFHLKERVEKYSEFAREVFGIGGKTSEKTALAGIQALEGWFKRIGVPTRLRDLGIPDDEFEAMAEDILITAEHWGITSYDKQKVLQILELCR